jgi:hypothetical protein
MRINLRSQATEFLVAKNELFNFLSLWVAKDSIDVGVEAHAPETDVGHEFFGRVEFTVATKHAFDKNDSRVGAQLLWILFTRLCLSFAVHVGLAAL